MQQLAIIVGGGAVILVMLFAFVVMVLFWKDPDKTKDMLGTLAMFVHSVRKKPKAVKHVHQRRTDPVPHEHVRQSPRKSLLLTMTDFVRRKPSDHTPPGDS